MKRPVIVRYIHAPIPDRRIDYIAYYEGEEEAGGYGYGASAAEAVTDFLDNHAEDHDERLSLARKSEVA